MFNGLISYRAVKAPTVRRLSSSSGTRTVCIVARQQRKHWETPNHRSCYFMFVYIADWYSCIMLNKEAPLSVVAKPLDPQITCQQSWVSIKFIGKKSARRPPGLLKTVSAEECPSCLSLATCGCFISDTNQTHLIVEARCCVTSVGNTLICFGFSGCTVNFHTWEEEAVFWLPWLKNVTVGKGSCRASKDTSRC